MCVRVDYFLRLIYFFQKMWFAHFIFLTTLLGCDDQPDHTSHEITLAEQYELTSLGLDMLESLNVTLPITEMHLEWEVLRRGEPSYATLLDTISETGKSVLESMRKHIAEERNHPHMPLCAFAAMLRISNEFVLRRYQNEGPMKAALNRIKGWAEDSSSTVRDIDEMYRTAVTLGPPSWIFRSYAEMSFLAAVESDTAKLSHAYKIAISLLESQPMMLRDPTMYMRFSDFLYRHARAVLANISLSLNVLYPISLLGSPVVPTGLDRLPYNVSPSR